MANIRPIEVQQRHDKTRGLILSALTRLVFAHGFENVRVQAIADAADVARSTFYEHFASKEDALRASMNFLFESIADCVLSDQPPTDLQRVLDHLWSNRRLADAIFSGRARRVLSRNQIDLIEGRLRRLYPAEPTLLRLASVQIAEGQIALIEAWLRGKVPAGVAAMSTALHRVSRGGAAALQSEMQPPAITEASRETDLRLSGHLG